jgi:hypothetical protein
VETWISFQLVHRLGWNCLKSWLKFVIHLNICLSVVMKADGNERKIALPFSFSYF